MRLYSHQNNSGCFFIAVIKKICNTDELFNTKVPSENVHKSIGDDLAEFTKFLGIKDPELEEISNKQITEITKKENEEIIFTQYVKLKEYKEKYEMVKLTNF